MGDTTRGMAFCTIIVILIGTAIGSMLPETGNVISRILNLPGTDAHVFNPVFCIIGIIGTVLALFIRR